MAAGGEMLKRGWYPGCTTALASFETRLSALLRVRAFFDGIKKNSSS
jgi:hypothetical protein